MTSIAQWLVHPWAQDLIGALCHSLWQGILIATVLYTSLNRMSKVQPQTRYMACLSALLILLCLVFGTFAVLQLEHPEPTTMNTSERSMIADSPETMVPSPTQFPEPQRHIQASRSVPWHTWALCVWAVGVCIMFVRMVGLLLGVHTLTRQSVPVENSDIPDLINTIKAQLGIGCQILVVTGEHILSPGVIGFFRPILLLPMSLATGVPSDDLEAILLHELAHIRRYDYVVNFFQMVIEALLFFNPTVWWINRQIRLEREACCDAVAVTTSGQRMRYAELLLQWSRQVPRSQTEVTAMVGFSQSPKQSLIERIKRIALPNHTPQIHLRLSSILGMFALSILLLAALWKTTDTTVVLAAKILTPAQRAHRIDKIDRSYGAQAVQYGPEDGVTIAGTVRAENGSDLPDNFYMSILGQSSAMSSSSGTWVKNGTFHDTMHDYFDTFYLLVERLDFAPAYVGPFHAEPGATIDNIEVVLTHGFPGVIEVVDEQNNPVEDAMFEGHYNVFKTFWSGSQNLQGLRTDKQGRAIIKKTIARLMTLDILAQGYQYVRNQSVSLEPNQPTRLILAASTPTTGTVQDDQTGTPIQGASLRLWKDHTSQLYIEGHGNIWATTDAQGKFALTTLSNSQPYTFIIEASDHQYTRVTNVVMGENGRVVRLKPKRHIRGHVLGDPPIQSIYDKESQSWTPKTPVLKFSCAFEDEYTFGNGYAALTESDGRFTFDISDVYGDTIEIKTGDKRVSLKFGDRDVDDLVIDLRPLAERTQDSNDIRTVVLQFNPPQSIDSNDFQVSISAVSQKDREAGQWGQWTKYRIQNNQIELTVPTPGLISYSRGSFNPYSDEGKYIRPLWIEGKNQIPVPREKSPFEIEVPLYPAGTIYGQIHVPEPTRLTRSSQDVDIQLFAVETPDYMTSPTHNREIPFNGYWHPTDKYSLAPVPLGGTYVVVAHYQFGWIKSEPIRLEQGSSIIQYDLDFPRGVDVTGTITSPQGQSLSNVSVSLQYATKIGTKNWSTPHHVIHADHQGRFVFAGVNPNIAGTYSLKIKESDDYEPVEMNIRPGTRPYHIKLTRAARITGRVVNSQGQPLDGLTVFANEQIKRTTFYQAAIASPSDSNGHFELKSLKHKARYELRVQDHSLQNQVRFTAGDEADLTLTVKD